MFQPPWHLLATEGPLRYCWAVTGFWDEKSMPRLRLVSMVHGFCEAVVRRDPRGKECAHTQVHPVRGGGDLSVVQVTLTAVLGQWCPVLDQICIQCTLYCVIFGCRCFHEVQLGRPLTFQSVAIQIDGTKRPGKQVLEPKQSGSLIWAPEDYDREAGSCAPKVLAARASAA